MRQMRRHDDPSDWPGPYYEAQKDLLDDKDFVSKSPPTAKFTKGPRELDFGFPTFVRDLKMARIEREEFKKKSSSVGVVDKSSSSRQRAKQRRTKPSSFRKDVMTTPFAQAERFNPRDPRSFLRVKK